MNMKTRIVSALSALAVAGIASPAAGVEVVPLPPPYCDEGRVVAVPGDGYVWLTTYNEDGTVILTAMPVGDAILPDRNSFGPFDCRPDDTTPDEVTPIEPLPDDVDRGAVARDAGQARAAAARARAAERRAAVHGHR